MIYEDKVKSGGTRRESSDQVCRHFKSQKIKQETVETEEKASQRQHPEHDFAGKEQRLNNLKKVHVSYAYFIQNHLETLRAADMPGQRRAKGFPVTESAAVSMWLLVMTHE